MHNDESTQPGLRRRGRDSLVHNDESTLGDDVTLLDPRRRGRDPLVHNDESTQPGLRHRPLTKPPAWPFPHERDKRPTKPSTAHSRLALGWIQIATLAASAAVVLSLLSLLNALSLTGNAGSFWQHLTAAKSSPGVSTTASTPTSDSASGWLQIAPSSVQFGCADHQRTQLVVLENRGSHQLHWQVSIPTLAGQSAVNISPGNGDLGPGESTAVQLQSTTTSAGVVALQFTNSAGSPATLTVTMAGCS